MRITEELVAEICRVIKGGFSQGLAAEYVGITPETLCRWKKRHKWVAQKIRMAQSHTKIALGQKIMDMAEEKKDWRGVAWMMERMFWEDFGEKKRHEVTGEGGGPLVVKFVSGLPTREAESLTDDTEDAGE